jgi:hypothetical protein
MMTLILRQGMTANAGWQEDEEDELAGSLPVGFAIGKEVAAPNTPSSVAFLSEAA